MMNQIRPRATKTASATLTLAEKGDIIANAASAITLTLPTYAWGLWYRISNTGAGVVTVYYSGTLTTLKQGDTALVFSNSGVSAWVCFRMYGSIIKSEVEAVLTGLISTHTHSYGPDPIIETTDPTVATEGLVGQLYINTSTPKIFYCSEISGSDYTWNECSGGGASAFIDLTDVPSSYAGQGGKLVKVTSSGDGLEFGDAPATTFLGLSDTPASYSGQAGKILRVNSTPNAVEFSDVPVIYVLGMYETLTDLQTAHPTGTAGDAYAVGTDASNEIYIWDPDTTAWVSIGNIKGPQGADGASGATIWGGM